MRVLRTLVVLVLLAAMSTVAACSSDARPSSSSSSSLSGGTSTTPRPTPPTAPGPVTTIPADLRLPHAGAWPAYPTDRLLGGECLDPPSRLRAVPPTDATDVLIADAGRAREGLAVFATPSDAAEEVVRWKGDLDRCGHGPQSHTGEPIDWYVVPAEVSGADEAWHAYQLSEDVRGVDQIGFDPFVTVLRVGTAVYASGVHHPGHLTEAAIRRLKAHRSELAARFVPDLGVFRST